MKLNKPMTNLAKFNMRIKSPAQEAVAGDAGTTPANSGGKSWLTKGATNIASEVANIRVQAQKAYAPEFYLKTGESKDIRFRSSEPIGLFRQYNVRVGGRWQRITAPPAGETDLMRQAGLKPSVRVAYEIIDVDGYVSKKDNKAHKNVPRFFITNMRLHEQLETIRNKLGSLTAFNINISRSGKGQQTTYTLLPEQASTLAGIEKIP